MYRIVILIALLLGACATQDGYRNTLNQFVDQPETKLYQAWGPPDSTAIDSQGIKHYKYSRGSTVTIPGIAPTMNTNCTGIGTFVNCSSTPVGGTDPMTLKQTCTTYFVGQEGIIRAWRADGNGCRA